MSLNCHSPMTTKLTVNSSPVNKSTLKRSLLRRAKLKSRQTGAALIIALLIVGMVTVVAGGMALDYVITVKRAANQLLAEQSYGYLLGAEQLAMKVLWEDGVGINSFAPSIPGVELPKPNTAIDTCDDMWAQEAPPFVIEEGSYGGSVHDLQGRFNINNLKNSPARVNGPFPTTVDQARFIRLLQSFNDEEMLISTDEAVAITAAVVDWVDFNSDVTSYFGAEDGYYESAENQPPQLTANNSMVDVSELLLIQGMTPKLYEKLLPHVTVWPLNGGSINVNTATPNVLRSLNVPKVSGNNNPATAMALVGPPLSELEIEPVLAFQSSGWEEIKDFIDSSTVYQNIDTAGLALSSEYFMLNGVAVMGDLTTRIYSVIHRSGSSNAKSGNGAGKVYVSVVSRSRQGHDEDQTCFATKAGSSNPDGTNSAGVTS